MRFVFVIFQQPVRMHGLKLTMAGTLRLVNVITTLRDNIGIVPRALGFESLILPVFSKRLGGLVYAH